MGVRRGIFVALVLLVASLGAMMSAAQIPVNVEPTDLKSSECWTCHADSTNGPPIPNRMYDVHGLPDVVIPIGEKGLFEVAVENVWTAELKEITGALDLTSAPELEFASEKEPISDRRNGVVAGTPGTDAQYEEETFTVPPGATDLVLQLQRDPQSSQTANLDDFRLHLFAPGRALDSSPSFNINNGGAGEPETFELHGLDEIAEAGTGVWTARIVIAAPSENNPDPVAFADHPYELTIDVDFRGTGVPVQYVDLGDTTLLSNAERPGQRVYLGWQILAEAMPNDPITIPVDVILIAHYDHAPNHSSYDDWRYVETLEIQVIPDPANDAIILRSSAAPNEVAGVSSFSWGILSEIVGYVSAVLILASIYTGGMFGKASRRQLNSLFGNAKRRVAFHNFLSYGILTAATAHTIIFLFEAAFHWTLGLLWGGIAILGMIGLGLTGALQVPMIRKWNYAVWRWSHFYLSIATIVFTVVHILLDGVHFADLQESIGWSNFLDPANRA